MILYLDTSSLIKLYLEEVGSGDVVAQVGEAHSTATSWIAYTEARSAFARKYREKGMSPAQYEGLLSTFEAEWLTHTAIEVSVQVLRSAGQLTEKHGLRALDAIHLASALDLWGGPTTPPLAVIFSSADRRLQDAARAEGLEVPRSTNDGH